MKGEKRDECFVPYGRLSACCPLLLEGGARGGREKYGPYLFYRSSIVCSATTPHPSSPEEGTTLGANLLNARSALNAALLL